MRSIVLIPFLVALASCSTTIPEGGRCVLNSDCSTIADGGYSLVCIYGRCHNPCVKDADCTKPQLCRMSVKPINVCLLPDELSCPGGTDRECPGPLVCGTDRVCRDPCKSNRDCLQGSICTQGVCATLGEVDAGLLPPPVDGPACSYTSECPTGSICLAGSCRAECLTSRDCPTSSSCLQGLCVSEVPDAGLPSGYGARCEFNSDCRLELLCGPAKTCTVECLTVRDCPSTSDCCSGFRCFRGLACTFTPGTPDAGDAGQLEWDGGLLPDGGLTGTPCLTDRDCEVRRVNWCDPRATCVNRRCVADRALCDDGDPCTDDGCDESRRSCVNVLRTTLTDQDGDGHHPTSCRGTGDDCDDTNARVYTGAPERCDFLDNDCNGQVDEGLWQADVASRGQLSAGQLYHGSAGAPDGLRVGNTVFLVANSDATVRGSLDLWLIDPVSFTPTFGPMSLGGSTTSWSSCFYQANPFYGRRSGLGQLAMQPDGGGMVAGVQATYRPNAQMCCEGGVAPIETAFATTFHGTSVADSGVLVAAPITGNGCDGAFNYYDRPITAASATWNESLGRYVVSWADKTRVAGTFDVLFATVDPVTGQLSAPRQVVQPSGVVIGSEMVSPGQNPLRPLVVASPAGVLFIWAQQIGGFPEARYAILNSTLTQRLAGPATLVIPPSQGRRPIRAIWSGTSFIVQLDNGANQTVNILASISPTGVQEWLTRLPQGRASTGTAVLGIEATDQPTFTLVGTRGFISANAQESRMTFTYGALGPDAGTITFDYDTGKATQARSAPTLITVDERTVLAIWADDELQRLALRCVE